MWTFPYVELLDCNHKLKSKKINASSSHFSYKIIVRVLMEPPAQTTGVFSVTYMLNHSIGDSVVEFSPAMWEARVRLLAKEG